MMLARKCDLGAAAPWLDEVLVCPRTNAAMRLTAEADALVSSGDAELRFPIEEGVVRAYLPHDSADSDVTAQMLAFYEGNPFPNYEGLEDVGSLIYESRARGFPGSLNSAIPPGSSVLEVGCGTGQLGSFLSVAKRQVLSVDMCMNSLQLAQQFKAHNGLHGVTFAQMNLFRLPLRPRFFDVVICTGVLHHTDDPRRGFEGLVPLVKPGGYLIIGLYNRYGRAKTRLRKLFGTRLASGDPRIRDTGVSGDKREAWIADQYRNPHESLHTIDEVFGWFDAHAIDFIRAIPSTRFAERFSPDYRRSLFEPESRGTRVDRLFSQVAQGFADTEGGLFIMIGRRR